MSKERRRECRFAARVKVRYDKGASTGSGVTGNISVHGLLIDKAEPSRVVELDKKKPKTTDQLFDPAFR